MHRFYFVRRCSSVAIFTSALLFAGCGGAASNPGPAAPVFSGTTQVTLLISSTANDRFARFGMRQALPCRSSVLSSTLSSCM